MLEYNLFIFYIKTIIRILKFSQKTLRAFGNSWSIGVFFFLIENELVFEDCVRLI